MTGSPPSRGGKLLPCFVLLLAICGGCFSVEEPPCAFKCGSGASCPDDYMCMPDNYCHKVGSTANCPFPDAGVTDMAAPVPGPDLASTDLAGSGGELGPDNDGGTDGSTADL